MKIYPISATVLDDICIARKQGFGNEYQTLPYIPGRAIWGAVASLGEDLVPGIPPSDPEFVNVFYSTNVMFSNLYVRGRNGNRALPVPFSLMTEKKAPGFLGDYEHLDYRPEGVEDWLAGGVPKAATLEEYINVEGFFDGHSQSVPVPLSQQVHHARDPNKGITAEGKLFSRITIPRETKLLGYIKVLDEQLQERIQTLIEELGIDRGRELPVGRKPGRILLKKEGIVRNVYEEASVLPDNKRQFLSLTCLSDAILIDDYQRYLPYVSENMVREALFDVIQSCKTVRYFSKRATVLGWNSAYQRPMETEEAIAMGSAFLFEVAYIPKKTDEQISAALNNLQAQGIGIRRYEGFGEIRVNDRIHFRAGRF